MLIEESRREHKVSVASCLIQQFVFGVSCWRVDSASRSPDAPLHPTPPHVLTLSCGAGAAQSGSIVNVEHGRSTHWLSGPLGSVKAAFSVNADRPERDYCESEEEGQGDLGVGLGASASGGTAPGSSARLSRVVVGTDAQLVTGGSDQGIVCWSFVPRHSLYDKPLHEL